MEQIGGGKGKNGESTRVDVFGNTPPGFLKRFGLRGAMHEAARDAVANSIKQDSTLEGNEDRFAAGLDRSTTTGSPSVGGASSSSSGIQLVAIRTPVAVPAGVFEHQVDILNPLTTAATYSESGLFSTSFGSNKSINKNNFSGGGGSATTSLSQELEQVLQTGNRVPNATSSAGSDLIDLSRVNSENDVQSQRQYQVTNGIVVGSGVRHKNTGVLVGTSPATSSSAARFGVPYDPSYDPSFGTSSTAILASHPAFASAEKALPAEGVGSSPLIQRELFHQPTLLGASSTGDTPAADPDYAIDVVEDGGDFDLPRTSTRTGAAGSGRRCKKLRARNDPSYVPTEVDQNAPQAVIALGATLRGAYTWVMSKMTVYGNDGLSAQEYGLRQVEDLGALSPDVSGKNLETFGLLQTRKEGVNAAASSPEDMLTTNSAAEISPVDEEATPKLTTRLLAACLFQLPMGMIWSTIGLIVLPYEAEKFYPKAHSGFLGLLLTIAGTSQVISPIVGRLSDDHRSIFGRRRPFMVYGTILTAAGVMGLSWSSAHLFVWVYAVALFISQVGLNVIYSATVLGLVPDVLEEQGVNNNAAASGIIAIFQFLGNLLGMLFMMATSNMEMQNVYPFYLVSVLVSSGIVWICCPEESSLNRKRTRVDDDTAGLYKALLFDAGKDPDFFWVFVGRTVYYLSISCLSFIYFFVRDIAGVLDEHQRKYFVALIVVCAQSTGALTAYPAGVLSDKVGRKKLVYVSCAMMALCYMWYLAIPYLPQFSTLQTLLLGSCIYGIAAGCYMSVDYALALDCLPEKSTKGSSEALGLWGISGFIGSYIGPMGGGGLLEFFGSTSQKDHYSYGGYFALLSVGALMALLSALVTSFIRKAS
ncbi:unnamed protein product [Amoebophrya sp. A25]|nr:unnamed protein product [Amoebophrya sp. A25]|eukprot:GSA25T00001909001.1